MNAPEKSITVELHLSTAKTLLSVLDIKRETGLDEATIRAELRTLAQQGQIEHIPGRGRYDGRYGLLRPIAKAAPAATSADGALSNEGTTERRLTVEAQADREEFISEFGRDGNCSCHISPPCFSCTRPGNPRNQDERDECWEADDAVSENARLCADEIGTRLEAAVEVTRLTERVTMLEAERDELRRSVELHKEVSKANAQKIMEQMADLAKAHENRDDACRLVASMHAVALGEVRGPIRGVVEDVSDLRTQAMEAAKELDAIRDLLAPFSGDLDPSDLSEAELAKHVASELTNARALISKLEHLLGVERQACAALREQLDKDGDALHIREAASAYLVKAPRRKPLIRKKPESAVAAAKAAARNGSSRGDVYALVYVGSARRDAVYREAKS